MPDQTHAEASPLRWGFLGASRIGRTSLAPAVLAQGQRLDAVAARDLARAQDFADAFGASRAYGDYAGLIADPNIDAVYIALTNDQHLPWTLRALEAGKHVLCEKPLALNAAEVLQMQEAVFRHDRIVAEAFSYRFNHQIVRLKEILRTGRLGEILSAHVMFGAMMPVGDFRWTASLGGGALYDIGGYCVDLLRLVFPGDPLVIAATQRPRGEVDASFAGMLAFPGGATGHFTCSFESARRQSLTVLGTEAMLTLDWPYASREPVVTLQIGDAVEHFGPSAPYSGMVAHFAAAARGQAPLSYGLDHSLGHARILDSLFAVAASTS